MKKITMIFGVLALLMLAACTTQVIMPEDEKYNSLSVGGKSEFDVSPDEAIIRVRVESQSLTAQEAQEANRITANNVREALRRAGIRDDEIETAEYNVRKVQEWDGHLERTVDKGYRVYNVFKITTKNLDKLGDYLDAAVQAGANNIDSVNFQLSDKALSEAKTEALRRSAKNARAKAEALADGMGVTLDGVLSVGEGSVNVYPMRAMAEMSMVKAGGMYDEEMAPTPIEPEAVRVSANVQVSYKIR
jgi:hypothetical protein